MVLETMFIGLVCSMLFVELTGFYAGGIIVPGYIALYIDSPLRIGGTLIIAILTLISYNFFSRYLIMYGRRRFVIMILIGSLWTVLGYQVLPNYFPEMIELRAIGWVIPGLIANTFQKQGILVTIASLAVVSALTYFIIKVTLII